MAQKKKDANQQSGESFMRVADQTDANKVIGWNNIPGAYASYLRKNADELAKYPPDMLPVITNVALGEEIMRQKFEQYDQLHGHSLREGQHPKYLVIAPFDKGNMKFVIGDLGAEAGNALMTRIPGGIGIDGRIAFDEKSGKLIFSTDGGASFSKKGKLSLSLRFSLELARSKKIGVDAYLNTSGSRYLKKAYRFHEAGGNLERLGEDIYQKPVVKAFLEDIKGIYDLVKYNIFNHGADYYEDRIVTLDPSDQSAVKEKLSRAPTETRFVRGMSMELIWLHDKLIKENDYGPETLASILRGLTIGMGFAWNGEDFIEIPSTPRKKNAFLERFPAIYAESPGDGYPPFVDSLIDGERVFRKAWPELMRIEEKHIHLIGTAGCADSRSLAFSAAASCSAPDPVLAELCSPAFRTAGNISAGPDLKLDREKALFLALEERKGDKIYNGKHLDCGFLNVVAGFHFRGDKLTPAFEEASILHKPLYDEVVKNGPEYYEKTFGVKVVNSKDEVKNIADAMAVQAVVWAAKAMALDFGGLEIHHVLQDVYRVKNILYYIDPNKPGETGKFVNVPSLVDRKDKPHHHYPENNKSGCNCGCS